MRLMNLDGVSQRGIEVFARGIVAMRYDSRGDALAVGPGQSAGVGLIGDDGADLRRQSLSAHRIDDSLHIRTAPRYQDNNPAAGRKRSIQDKNYRVRQHKIVRTEERSVGKECVSTCKPR